MYGTPDPKLGATTQSSETEEQVSAGEGAEPQVTTPQTPHMERGGVGHFGGDDDPQEQQDVDEPTEEELKAPALTGNEKHFYDLRREAEKLEDARKREVAYDLVMNLEILHHVLLHVLRIGPYPPLEGEYPRPHVTGKLEEAGIDNIHSLITMDEEDLKSIGVTENIYGFARKLKRR